MNIPATYGPAIAGIAFLVVGLISNWISDWQFKRQMERLDDERQARENKPTCPLCGQKVNDV